jgi:hypothetical protein
MRDERVSEREDSATWPYTSILVFGFFGADTPAGRRLAWRTTFALAAFLMFSVGVHDAVLPAVPAAFWVVGLAVSVVGIGLSYWLYLRALDELSQLLQLKAFAFAYGCVMVIAATLFGASIALTDALRPQHWLALLVIAEPLRGAALAYLARRHA